MNLRFFSKNDCEGLENQRKELLEIWSKCPSCDDFEPADIFDMVDNGGAVICSVQEEGRIVLAGAFEFAHYPRQLAVNVMAIAGAGMDRFIDEFFEKFVLWCRLAGADVIEARCAPAMARLLGRNGFKPAYTVVRHSLEV